MDVRTWIEIDKKALHHNVETFLRMIPKETRFMVVIKSNAYGHGLVHVAKLLQEMSLRVPTSLGRGNLTLNSSINDQNVRLLRRSASRNDRRKISFGVDSIVEALRLRKEGVKNFILVLGHTLPSRVVEAAEHDIAVSISNFDALRVMAKQKKMPAFHIKIDTGMHRQGFQLPEIPRLAKELKEFARQPEGIFTHFAAAKDAAYPTYTRMQLAEFYKVLSVLEAAGIHNMIRHAAATGGTLLFPESHLDMTRVGMGIYGYWPSLESQIFYKESKVMLKPVLTWKTVVGEVKDIPNGSVVGYDVTEKVHRKSKIAVLPIGYWHGYDRGLSSIGEVLIRGTRARILGRISMDMTVVDITDVKGVRVGDEAVIIGKQGKQAMWADELSLKIGTSPYEFLTRINPLIRRIII